MPYYLFDFSFLRTKSDVTLCQFSRRLSILCCLCCYVVAFYLFYNLQLWYVCVNIRFVPIKQSLLKHLLLL